jgi:M6 family metalloprotease-like protein/uncharacterized repeat protein (TIGR01451 family)
VRIVARIDTHGSFATTARVAALTRDPNPRNNPVTTRLVARKPLADLAVSLTASPESAPRGVSTAYSVSVSDLGPDPASDVLVTDILPAGLAFDAAHSTVTCGLEGVEVTCYVDRLPATVTIAVRATAVGRIPNTVSVSSTTSDPHPDNNGATAEVTATEADAPNEAPCSPTLAPGTNRSLSAGSAIDSTVRGVPSTGSLKAITLFVDFPDAPTSETTKAAYDRNVPGVADYYAAQSGGRLRLDISAGPSWYRMSKDWASYGFPFSSFAQQQAYMQEAINLADKDVDFSQYQLVYVVPTVLPEGVAVTGNAAAVAFVAPHSITYALRADGSAIYGGAVFNRLRPVRDWTILAHETGHTLGLPDLYDTAQLGTTDASAIFGFVGGWSPMGGDHGESDFFAFEKFRLGWIDPTQVRCLDVPASTTQALTPEERPGGLKMIVARPSPSVAYAVEVRSLTGSDSHRCSQGVLVYRIDATVSSGAGPVKVLTPHSGTAPSLLNLCHALYDAPLIAGESWEDAQFKVQVIAANADGSYVVRSLFK